MKGAIASVEIFVFEGSLPGPFARASVAGRGGESSSEPGAVPRRLSLAIAAPERSPTGDGWQCRVALADLHRAQTFEGRDSIESLFRAVEGAKAWLADLEAEGFVLARDRAGTDPFVMPFLF